MVGYGYGCLRGGGSELRLNQATEFERKSPLYWLYAAVGFGILLVGLVAVVEPLAASGLFGVPVSDARDITWVRIAGMRDVSIGLVFVAMLLFKERRVAGILVLLTAVIPVSDAFAVFSAAGMSYQVLMHGGSTLFLAALGILLMKKY
jgi:hypothetical protein